MSELKNESKYYSIFNRFLSIVALIFISVITMMGWKIDSIKRGFVYSNLHILGQDIKHHSDFSFNLILDKMKLISSFVIKKEVEKNYDSINKFFEFIINSQEKQLIQLHSIKWADDKNVIRASNFYNLEISKNASNHLYFDELEQKSQSIHFDKALLNNIKQTKLISISKAIQDKHNNFLGTLILEIDIQNFINYVNSRIKETHGFYLIINHFNYELTFQSANLILEDYYKIQSKLIEQIKSANEESSFFIKNKTLVLYRLDSLPFTVVIGKNHEINTYKEYFKTIAPYKHELFFSLLIIILLIYSFYNSILEPFLTLSEAAIKISQGDVLSPIPQINSKEGAQVVKALEQVRRSFKNEKNLVMELSEVRNKLSLANLRLENKVAERTEALEKVLSDKTKFLDQLSHEIKMPLQGISTIAENLISYWSEFTEAIRFEFVHQISFSSAKILALVNNLLDLSKLTSNKNLLNTSKVNFTELVNEVIKECNTLYLHKKSVNINFSHEVPVYLTVDRERLTQVLRNLFVNAINHSGNHSFIAAKIFPASININKKTQEAIHFMIHDHGTGINEEEIAVAFSSITPNKFSDVAWLGLKVCYEIIQAHRGKIWASNNKDGGATFNFILPIAESNHQEDLIPFSIDLSSEKPNILMIDDEESSLGSMDLILYNSNYNLIKCNSAHLGLKYLEQHYKYISLIMLDLMMPDIYGLNVLTEIKNNPNTASIPVILQTGSSDEDEIIKAFNIGASFFIRKPFKKKVVLEEVEKALHMYKLNNQDNTIQ